MFRSSRHSSRISFREAQNLHEADLQAVYPETYRSLLLSIRHRILGA